jgi:hypothetical protein
MNERIAKLEKTVYQLVTHIKTSGLNNNVGSNLNYCYNTGISTKYETNIINKEDFESVRKGCQVTHNTWAEILQELKVSRIK